MDEYQNNYVGERERSEREKGERGREERMGII